LKIKDFVELYGPSISRVIDENLRPVYTPGVSDGGRYLESIQSLLRRPFRVQEEVIKGLSRAIYEEGRRRIFCVGEQGSGKTFIALSVIACAGRPVRGLVVCPSHLVKKWIREAKNTIPDVETVDISGRNAVSILDALRWRERIPQKTEIYVISRERVKLGYKIRPAVVSDREGLIRCPRCLSEVKNPQRLFRKEKQFCKECREALWQADEGGIRRYPPATFIKKYLKGYFDIVVLDEIQDYKSGETLQGESMGDLVAAAPITLCLTGTLNGGYADDLFHLLFRVDPSGMKEFGFEYTDSIKWMKEFGVVEKVFKSSDENKGVYRRRPGVSPAVIGKFLLDKACFIRLADIIDGLPPYEENVVALAMDSIQGKEYKALEKQIKNAYERRIGPAALYALLSYPDSCGVFAEEIELSDNHKIVAPVLNGVFPKERELIALALAERKAGRKVLCYLTFTNRRDIRPRLKQLLEGQGIRVGVLNASIPPVKREEWIAKHAGDMDVLLLNSELVKTGLDLYDFPTVVFYQTGYNIFTLRQAARRSWRIGQTQPVRVFFFCYQGTVQETALSLIAKKLGTALLVEGDLPEGLADYVSDEGSIAEDIINIITSGGNVISAEKAWSDFRKKEIEMNLGLGQKETIFSELTEKKASTPDSMTAVTGNVVVKVTILGNKKKRQSTLEVKYGDLDSVLNGRAAQFALF